MKASMEAWRMTILASVLTGVWDEDGWPDLPGDRSWREKMYGWWNGRREQTGASTWGHLSRW
jgi:hypothetical protein